MDTYSFGMILWELWHNSIPFDNDTIQAQQYVLKEEARPKILCTQNDNESDNNEEEEAKVESAGLAVNNMATSNDTSIDSNPK